MGGREARGGTMVKQEHVESELVFVDGSGAEGLYRMYGHRFAASASHEHVTVRCLTAREHGYVSGREKGTVSTACKAITKRLAGFVAECHAAGRQVAA